jgi:hypothetical protein
MWFFKGGADSSEVLGIPILGTQQFGANRASILRQDYLYLQTE